MSYFRTAAEALHLAISDDGLAWLPLGGDEPILWSEIGSRSLRDPHLWRARDGRFHLFATDGWRSDSLFHAVSEDLLHWTDQTLIPVMRDVPGARNCWAPECFYDHEGGLYRILWSSSTTPPTDAANWNHRIWGTTTRDFQSYTPARVFLDPGYSVIDATVAWHAGRYLLALKDERGENAAGTGFKAIRVCWAERADGPYSAPSEPVSPPLTEGPTLFRREGVWVMFCDHFTEDRYGALSSADGRVWTDITAQVTFPTAPRHASVLPVDSAVAAMLAGAHVRRNPGACQ